MIAGPHLVMTGYSDRINHALAFAAKHHDQQVRRGTRPPYSTQSANLAIILTRYGCDEDTVTAGILLDVVEDYLRDGFSAEVLEHRIADKFGARVLEITLMVAERRTDDEGMDLGTDERRADQVHRVGTASTEGQMLAASDSLHGAGTLLADLQRTVDVQSVWARVPGGRARALDTYRKLQVRLQEAGLGSPIVEELRQVIGLLDAVPA